MEGLLGEEELKKWVLLDLERADCVGERVLRL